MALLLIILYSIKNMTDSASLFNQALDNYNTTIEPQPGGDPSVPPQSCSEVMSNPLAGNGSGFYDAGLDQANCQMQVDFLRDFQSPSCSAALNAACHSQNMWDGYLPTIISFGMIVPALIMLTLACCSYRIDKKINITISDESITLIKVIAESYKININAENFKETIKENFQLFKNRLRDINRVIKFLGQLNDTEINYIEEYINKYSLTEFPTLDSLIENGSQVLINDFNFILSHKEKEILRNITDRYTSTDLRDQYDIIESYIGASKASENATPIRTLLYSSLYQQSNLQTFFKKMDEYYLQTHQNEVRAIVAISNNAEDANEEIDVNALVQPLKDNCNNFKREIFERILMFAGVENKVKTPKFQPRFLDNKTVGIRLV